jgi:hypothetical protein
MGETLCSIDWLKVAQVFQALLAPAIGIATVAIGVLAYKIQRQQAITNRLQYRLALFEKRMKVFDAAMEVIAVVLKDARIELDRLFQFLREAREHELLFGPEIKEHLDLIYKKGVALNTINFVNRPEEAGQREEVLQWFTGQSAETTNKFLKYIDFREP